MLNELLSRGAHEPAYKQEAVKSSQQHGSHSSSYKNLAPWLEFRSLYVQPVSLVGLITPPAMCASTANARLASCRSKRGGWDVFSQMPSSPTRNHQYSHKQSDLQQSFQATGFGTVLLPLCSCLFLKLPQPSHRDTNGKVLNSDEV